MDFELSRRSFMNATAASAGGLLLGCGRQDNAAPAWEGPTRHRRNLLFVTIDTLRADHVGCCGYSRPTTPCIDRLAAEGVLFDQVNTQYCLTWPALASIMASTSLARHGVKDNETLLSERVPTLGTALDAAGFDAGAFLGFAEKQRWLGFDEVTGGRDVDDDTLSDRLLAWLDKQQASGHEAPYFAWIHFYGPHLPWRPGPEDSALFTPEPQLQLGSIDYQYRQAFTQEPISGQQLQSITDLYDAEIRRTDDCIAKILDHLTGLGLLDDTLVAVSADHGTELYDHHNYALHWGSPYNGVYQVPLVLWGPDTVPQGQQLSRPVRSIDLAPTLLELLDQPAAPSFQGRSLLSVLKQSEQGHPVSVSEFAQGRVLIVREGTDRMIFNPESHQNKVIPPGVVKRLQEEGLNGGQFVMPLASRELYDLLEDPREQRNLASTLVNRTEVMSELARAWHAENNEAIATLPGERVQDPEHEDALEALGYL